MATLGVAISVCDAQSRRRPPSTSYAPIGLPDQAEGERILETSRNIGFGDSFYLEFELKLLPRTGAERVMEGRWFGMNNASGPINRIEILPPSAQPEILIVQSGPQPKVWRRDAGGRAADVSAGAAFAPIAGSQISAADLQTPFLHWREFTYEGMLRFRGRPTHVFLLYPPEDQLASYPEIGGVRAFVDTEYSALSQVQWVEESGKPIKTISAGSVRKVPGSDRWIVTVLEVRDDRTRNKTRLSIKAAALDLPLPGELFIPDGELLPTTETVPEELVRRFE